MHLHDHAHAIANFTHQALPKFKAGPGNEASVGMLCLKQLRGLLPVRFYHIHCNSSAILKKIPGQGVWHFSVYNLYVAPKAVRINSIWINKGLLYSEFQVLVREKASLTQFSQCIEVGVPGNCANGGVWNN
jgi:hypothetical protein